jgi:hypothetical protein
MALVVAGRFGRARYEIKPLSEDVLLFRNPLSAGCLTVVRRDGAVTGFLMNTARTRRLLFTRSAE